MVRLRRPGLTAFGAGLAMGVAVVSAPGLATSSEARTTGTPVSSQAITTDPGALLDTPVTRPGKGVTGAPLSRETLPVLDKRSDDFPARLRTLRAATRSGKVRVLVEIRDGAGNKPGKSGNRTASGATIRQRRDSLVSHVTAARGSTVVRTYGSLPRIVALQVTRAGLDRLASNPQVATISRDDPTPLSATSPPAALPEVVPAIPALGTSIPRIGADATKDESGGTGRRKAVAVIDTGVDTTHPWFDGRVVAEACFATALVTAGSVVPGTACPDGTAAMTGAGSGAPCTWTNPGAAFFDCWHGTHVAGIAVGQSSDDTLRGVAPEADLVVIRAASLVTGAGGAVSTAFTNADQIAALNWVATNADDFNIVAVNMSLGGPLYAPGSNANPQVSSCRNTMPAYTQAVAALARKNIPVVAAAGNEYFANNINFPACIPQVISVGATKPGIDEGLYLTAAGTGTNRAGALDVAAPGQDITSAIPITGAATEPTITISGTSMATPHVAGAIAVLRQLQGSVSIADMRAAMRSTARLNAAPENDANGNQVNLYRLHLYRTVLAIRNHTDVIDGSGGGSGKISGNVGRWTETVKFGQEMHRFWYDVTNQNLRHVITYPWGNRGNAETVDGNSVRNGRVTGDVGTYISAVAKGDALHVFYRDKTRGNLRHAIWKFNRWWSFEDVDGAGGVGGRVNANVGTWTAAVATDDRLEVYYRDESNRDLRWCRGGFGNWTCETIDGQDALLGRINGDVGTETAALRWGTATYVFYRDVTNGDLRLVSTQPDDPNDWNRQTLDGDLNADNIASGRGGGQMGYGISAELLGGRPAVFYHDDTFGSLRMARSTNTGWVYQVVDGNGGTDRTSHDVGRWTASVLVRGKVHVFYADTQVGELRVATVRMKADGTAAIHPGPIDGKQGAFAQTWHAVGNYVSAAAWDNVAHVTYQDSTDTDTRAGFYY